MRAVKRSIEEQKRQEERQRREEAERKREEELFRESPERRREIEARRLAEQIKAKRSAEESLKVPEPELVAVSDSAEEERAEETSLFFTKTGYYTVQGFLSVIALVGAFFLMAMAKMAWVGVPGADGNAAMGFLLGLASVVIVAALQFVPFAGIAKRAKLTWLHYLVPALAAILIQVVFLFVV